MTDPAVESQVDRFLAKLPKRVAAKQRARRPAAAEAQAKANTKARG